MEETEANIYHHENTTLIILPYLSLLDAATIWHAPSPMPAVRAGSR